MLAIQKSYMFLATILGSYLITCILRMLLHIMARGGLFSSDKTNKSPDYGIQVFFAICDVAVDSFLEQRT